MTLLPLSFQSYESRSLGFSAQRLVNLYWETAPEAAKSQGLLFGRPGLSIFTAVGPGPIRGIHTMKGVPFIVSGQNIFTLDSQGIPTNLGSLPGTKLVDMADNGTQVAIVSGTSGFIATTSTVTQITDSGFRAVSSVTYMDSFFVWTENDTARFFLSPSFEGLGPYDPLDVATAEFAPDNLVKTFADHDELLNMGKDTVEPWWNSGEADFPYTQSQGTTMEVGIVARDTVRKLDNTVFWLGSDERGGLTVWRSRGRPERVSTHALESQWDQAVNIQDSYAFTFRMEGHAFYVLTIQNFGTYVYDAATNLWCEWQTFGEKDWNAIGFSNAFSKRLTGNRRGNQIYEISIGNLDDAGLDMQWIATSPPVASENGEWMTHHLVRLDIDTGTEVDSNTVPEIYIDWADEDGEKYADKKLMSIGAKGETKKRAYRRRLGKARSRNYRFTGIVGGPVRIKGAYWDGAPGEW